jgi:hypothetical protein
MRRATRILVVALGLGALCFCGEARALFVGTENDNDAETNNGNTNPAGDANNTGPGHTAASGERLVNPFDKTPALNTPETMPEDVVRRASEWYNRPHNSKRFDRLLNGGTDAPAVAYPAARGMADTGTPPARKPGHALDYLIGAIAIGGVGILGFLLLRGRATT